jgi:hypothetical protein
VSGLTDKAGGEPASAQDRARQTQAAWQESMLAQLEALRAGIQTRSPLLVAERSGAELQGEALHLSYWGERVRLGWPGLEANWAETGQSLSTFDRAMLVYYLHQADGAPPAGRWIGFRELPHGAFYHQAFQGYSGRRLAGIFGQDPSAFDQACRALGGERLSGLAEHAWAFQPLPRLLLAAALWPGDEDFPAQASVLFDASSPHYLVTDGLALLGSGLASRLVKAGQSQATSSPPPSEK